VGVPKNEFKCLCPDGMHISSNGFDCLCPDEQKPSANNTCDDKENDCHDGSDEKNCGIKNQTQIVCKDEEFRCTSTGSCISLQRRCDSENDCPDASDETNCNRNTTCDPWMFPCGDGKCIYKTWTCGKLAFAVHQHVQVLNALLLLLFQTANLIVLTRVTKRIASPQPPTPPARRRQLTSIAPSVRIGHSSVPTTNASLTGGSVTQRMIAVTTATREVAIEVIIQRSLRQRKCQSLSDADNMTSSAILAFVFRGVMFATALPIVEEVSCRSLC